MSTPSLLARWDRAERQCGVAGAVTKFTPDERLTIYSEMQRRWTRLCKQAEANDRRIVRLEAQIRLRRKYQPRRLRPAAVVDLRRLFVASRRHLVRRTSRSARGGDPDDDAIIKARTPADLGPPGLISSRSGVAPGRTQNQRNGKKTRLGNAAIKIAARGLLVEEKSAP